MGKGVAAGGAAPRMAPRTPEWMSVWSQRSLSPRQWMTLEPMRVMTWLQWEKERAWSCESCSRTSLERAWPGMRLQNCLRADSFDAVELMLLMTPGGLTPVGCY